MIEPSERYRRRGDGLRLLAAWTLPARRSLDATAERIRTALE